MINHVDIFNITGNGKPISAATIHSQNVFFIIDFVSMLVKVFLDPEGYKQMLYHNCILILVITFPMAAISEN